MKTLITLLLVLVSVVTVNAHTIVKEHHAERAGKVDSRYIRGMVAKGFTYKVELNSKNQLIYVFTKITVK